ncbi:MAG TPA: cytochrome c [Burkholderiaceae bacterium]|nr:cytochrome c [Burkholderiaceae bacterium]
MRKIAIPLACAVGLMGPVQAQFSKPERAVEYRQAAFTIMNNHMGRISQAVQGKIPYDKDAVLRSAEIIEIVGKLPYEAFGPGTDLMESKAKPSIWKEESKFRQLAADMQAETVKLTAAAKSGNLDSVRSQFRATAKSCDACHDAYREK